MADLTPEHFSEYFTAVHGKDATPFPWQTRLLQQVARDGRWPETLDLPTGSGKTAAIDVALFQLALDAALPPKERRAARRVVLVVDRRTVVDQGYARARKIADALSKAESGILRIVRERLCSLGGTKAPLRYAQLRGGMPRDDDWAARPDQPVVAVSTVDQVGSRLLFRGYGVKDAMKPIHAGLLGHDTLILLDEVHLSEPFRQTLAALSTYRTMTTRRPESTSGTNAPDPSGGAFAETLPDRWQFVSMSATPGDDKPCFSLDETDYADARLKRRLDARKPTECREVKVSGREEAKRAAFAEELAKQATRYASAGRIVGVVVNRVATALAVFALLEQRYGTEHVHLVTGRMRPLDRNDLDRRITELVSSGRTRDANAPPRIVVSTQCIEAGADFDFDALVTECASLDALRQRFGRLNRLGDIEDAAGTVLVRSDVIAKDEADPVYGAALTKTWAWLAAAPRDFGIRALGRELPPHGELVAMLPPKGRAPVMLPGHLDAWVETNPPPSVDPDVALWLHGVERKKEADVQIVWRADITRELIEHASGAPTDARKAALEAILERLEVCPPSGLEALAVPFAAAKAWLERSTSGAPEVADVEAGVSVSRKDDDRDRRASNDGLWAVAWRGADATTAVRASELRPGMTIVVPSTYGGLTRETWDPSASAPVEDLGDRARFIQTGRPTFRLDAARWDKPELFPRLPVPSDDEAATDDPVDDVKPWIDAMSALTSPAVPEWAREILSALSERRSKLVVVPQLDGVSGSLAPAYFALVGERAPKKHGDPEVRSDQEERGDQDVSTEDDGGSAAGVEVPLDEHMQGVKSYAGQFAERCGLPTTLVRDVELAARWHDAGKIDPRFQRWLRGGSPLAEVAPTPLAKSNVVINDLAARRRARARSGYPVGMRHELASLSLLEAAPELLRDATDKDLVLYLVASHHGWCRPFAPVVEDAEPVELVFQAEGITARASSRNDLAALDSGVAERFWTLVGRYGWFGLAWLEAILRLADHRRSEYEQRRGSEKKLPNDENAEKESR